MNDPAQATQPPAGKKRRRSRSAGPGSTMLAAGEPMVWLTGGALVMALAMIVGLLALVFWLGSTTFLVAPLVQVDLLDGTSQLGEVSREESVPLTTELIFREPPNIHKAIMAQLLGSDAKDSWQGLPAEVAAHAEGLRKEASEVAARLADVQRTLTALEAAQGPAPQSPAARAEWVRNNTRAEKLAATRQQVETLTARQEALTRQAATAEQTAAAIRQQASAEPLAAILALDEEAQTVVVDSLLRRQARQQGLPNVLARRRLLRTGNYDVTQTHFTWVADYQIKPEGESRPEWAVLVERQKEGNFYGVLDALVVRHPRTIQEDEELLSRQIQWLDEHAAAIKAPGQKDLFTQALAKLRGDRDKLRVERGAQFVQEFATPTTHQGTMSAVTASARQIPLEKFQADKLEADDPVVEVRESFIDPATAWQQFEVRHAEALTLRDAQDAAEHNAEGRKHQALEDARLACKEAELALSGKDADQLRLPILELAQRLAARDRAVADSKQQIENADQTLDALRKQYGPQSAPAQAALLVAAEVRASSERRLAKLSTEAAVAQRQLAAEPASAQRAVAVYLSAEQTAAAAPEFATGPHHSPKKTRVTYELRLKTAQKKPRSLPLEEIVRAIPANRLSARQSTQIYFSRWWEFLTAKPRNGNSEGGVFPAIFGTVVMTLLMSLAVVPFGVLAALYLREYAKPGPVVSLIRISINNLAGVPSIVFGVFGLGFFCYIVGAYIDGGPRQAQFTPLPLGRWITLATVAAVVCVLAFCAGLFDWPRDGRKPRAANASGGSPLASSG